jgi:hypothetical protein
MNDRSRIKTEMLRGEIEPRSHLLHFYEDEPVLLDALYNFIVGGFQVEECIVVIATPQHRFELEKRLRASGIDLEAAEALDQYIILDAEQTLSQFIVNGWPDEALFTKVVSGILNRADNNGWRVRAFSEMVSLLLAKSHSGAALRLEQLWDKLCHTEMFSLFCACPKSSTQDLSSITEIRATHSKIIGDSQPRFPTVESKIVD